MPTSANHMIGKLPAEVVGEPQWITSTLRIKPGRDPLGFQTITSDRIMPQLLPGILALSQRARYISFHAFLLSEYQSRRLPATSNALSAFIKAREFELGVAAEYCSRRCWADGIVGKRRTDPAARQGLKVGVVERGESVESHLGGYGLYYRTPMSDLGLVAREGTMLGEEPTPIDVLLPDSLAQPLAESFRACISQTRYYQKYMFNSEPIPKAVLAEYAEAACLCGIHDSPVEQQLLFDTILGPATGPGGPEAEQRRRSMALFLALLEGDHEVAYSAQYFRRAIWDAFVVAHSATSARTAVLSQWAALIAKDWLQQGLTAVWSDLCRFGLRDQPSSGFNTQELNELVSHRLLGSGTLRIGNTRVAYTPTTPTSEFGAAVDATSDDHSLEDLRQEILRENPAVGGLALVLTLCARLPDPKTAHRGWRDIGSQHSEHQSGLLEFAALLERHLRAEPSLSETISWLVRQFILVPHERIAYGDC